MYDEKDKTLTFSLNGEKDDDTRKILLTVYAALIEKGYDPINQIVGYVLSEDPTYITNHKNARSLIRKIKDLFIFSLSLPAGSLKKRFNLLY